MKPNSEPDDQIAVCGDVVVFFTPDSPQARAFQHDFILGQLLVLKVCGAIMVAMVASYLLS
jgi:hypothetical protein